MAARFRPLLPAQSRSGTDEPLDPAEVEKPNRRSAVLVACTACQKAKSKCSGTRPVCHRCGIKGIACEYDVEPNQTRAASRREAEEQLRELFTYLQVKSWSEALEILRRIRQTPDPLEVVRLIRAGDLLLHKTVSGARGHTAAERQDPSPRYLDQVEGPSSSYWTTAADDFTVQTLIDTFFKKDQRFLISFIDRDMFVRDMQAMRQRPYNGMFCSALLIIAICAITACHCPLPPGMHLGSRRDLGENFFSEAKNLLNLEAGRPSLSTAQALFVMFSYCCSMGRDRAGNVFRAAGYEMVERMMPNIRRQLANTKSPADSRRAISTAVWGLFCFDSICSSVYLRPSLFSAPDVPRPSHLVPGVGRPENESDATEPAQGRGRDEHGNTALKHAYDLSEIFRKALDLAVRRNLDSEGGIASTSQLAQLYRELQTLQSKLPLEEEYYEEYRHEHCHMWAYHHVVAANITRLLQHSDTQVVSMLEQPLDACVHHCESIIEHVDRHLSRYPSRRQSSLAALYFVYTGTITLLDHAGTSPSVVKTFTRACKIFYEATDYPLSILLLEGLAAVAHRLGMQLPTDTLQYFSDLKVGRRENGSIPLGFVVPVRRHLLKLTDDDIGELSGDVEIGLDEVLARSRERIS